MSTILAAPHTITKSIELADDWSTVDWYRWDCTCGMSGLHQTLAINNMDARHHETGTGKWKPSTRR